MKPNSNSHSNATAQTVTKLTPVFWRLAFLFSLTLVLILGAAALAGEQNEFTPPDRSTWSSFRGDGSSSVSATASIPMTWTPQNGIAWQVELPGYGQSSPLIIGEKVIVTAVDGPMKERNLLVCIDRKSGQQIWKHEKSTTLQGPSNYMFSRAAPTPIVDESKAIALFESGDVVAVDLNRGEEIWSLDLKKEFGQLKSRHGLGSSLAQTEDLLFINLEHDGPSALLAISKSDGGIKWKSDRPSGSSWSSPTIMRRGNQIQVIVSSAGEVAGYDAETGEALWKIAGLVGNSVPSPLVVGNRIYLGARLPEFGSVSAAAKSNLCLEFEEGVKDPKIAWRSSRCVSDYASPVVCGENLFLINGDGILGCLDKDTGEEKYRQRLGMVCWATPIVHNDHLFVFGKNGKATVLKSSGEFVKVTDNRLWDAENPPRPDSYVEHYPKSGGYGSHAGGTHGGGHNAKKDGKASPDHVAGHGEPRSNANVGPHSKGAQHNPGGGMLAGMLKRDTDGDGVLSGDEIPGRLNSVMENIDLNRDGSLDKDELKKMADSFAAKRKGSRDSSRDPIVYGVAADSEGIIVRTGTRLYAIGGIASNE